MATPCKAVLLTLSDHRLPHSAVAMRAQHLKGRRPWLSKLRALWPVRVRPLLCDRCSRSMLEFEQLSEERLCIRCTADNQLARSAPALAGAVAVLRTLWMEADIERQAHRERPFDDSRRANAIRETAEAVLWWLTPCDVRPPGVGGVGETIALQAISTFDRTWALRCSTRTLAEIYRGWAASHAKVLRAAAHVAVDRQYAALIADETPDRDAHAGQEA
jgi:hypothetical protein